MYMYSSALHKLLRVSLKLLLAVVAAEVIHPTPIACPKLAILGDLAPTYRASGHLDSSTYISFRANKAHDLDDPTPIMAHKTLSRHATWILSYFPRWGINIHFPTHPSSPSGYIFVVFMGELLWSSSRN